MAVTDRERAIVLAAGAASGWPARELDAAIAIESGWNPAALNPKSKAAGLIQFMPFVLAAMGWSGSPEDFAKLSAEQQAPFVGKHFAGIGKKWRIAGDTYLAIAAPAFVGAPSSTVVYAKGSKAWDQNPLWRGPDGEITAGSIRQLLLERMAKRPPLPASSRSSSGGAVVALVLLFVAFEVFR